jgi:hypothetical protein
VTIQIKLVIPSSPEAITLGCGKPAWFVLDPAIPSSHRLSPRRFRQAGTELAARGRGAERHTEPVTGGIVRVDPALHPRQ